MKKILILLLLGGCSLFKARPELSDTAKENPEWIYAPYESCSETQELCAVGEAKGFSQADIQAKINLASVFEVKIQSELNVSSSGSQTFPWQSQVREEVNQSLKESVDQILENVQISKHYKKDGLSYSLAKLDRVEASGLLGNRLKKIDEELAVLWQKKQRTNLRKVVRQHLEREKLNERYSIVAGVGRPSPVSYAEILKWRESRPQAEPLLLKIGQAPDWLKEKLKELLTESGFKIVNSGNTAKSLTVNVDSLKEFLNVSGFEKHTFTLKMTSFEGDDKKRVVSTSETVTGRTQADALLKIKTLFTEYIEQHLSDLHLD